MTTPNEEVQGQTDTTSPVAEGTDTTQVETQENVSPWAQYLEPLPESVRPLVEPAFKDWDANVTKKFQSLHSEYEPYKPFIEEYEPDAIAQALSFIQKAQEDPKGVIQLLTEAFGLSDEQGTANSGAESLTPTPTEEDESFDDPYAPKFKQLEDMVGKLAEILLGNQEQERQQQEVAQLEQTLNSLKEKHGEYDENYVLALMSQGVDPEEAVKQFHSTIQGYASKLNAPQAQAPVVVGASGGYPATPIQPQDLSDSKATRALVEQMLAQAAQQ